MADCVAEEPELVVTAPTAGSLLTAGATYTVTWQGGSPSGSVTLLLMCTDCGNQYNAFTGFGFPTTSVANTHSFNWTVTAGIPSSSTYTLMVVSTSDLSNFDISHTFSVDGTASELPWVATYEWVVTDWTACSKVCDGGTQTRNVSCTSSTGQVQRANSLQAAVVTDVPTKQGLWSST